MRIIVQRVNHASCIVNNETISEIGQGYLLYIGFCLTDNKTIVDKLVKKLAGLRVFSDELGRLNLDIIKVSGSVLAVSQFTLYGDITEGNRPSFTKSLPGKEALILYDYFCESLKNMLQLPVKKGVFGEHMYIKSLNDGPVTIIIDSNDFKVG